LLAARARLTRIKAAAHRRAHSGAMTLPALFTPELLARLDSHGPRYTSYPTVDRFQIGFGAADYAQALERRAALARLNAAPPLALYVHVPFCESVCYYCACNKIVTRRHERAAAYLDTLEREIAMHARALGARQRVAQLHFGGGTPTFLSDAELSRLMGALRAAFAIAPEAECSIEVDPRTADRQRLAHLRALGFGRISFGVQDFDPEVQEAVHRVQPFEQVAALMLDARALGFGSINVDLIHGLPRQTPERFARTLRRVTEIAPDRIALYGYAHLPERFKPQRRIDAAELPTGAARLAMLAQAIEAFGDAGYDYIGMDHFARADDALARAKREGRLRRNFQGYTAQPFKEDAADLIGLGVSAIGQMGAALAQNAKTLDAYTAAIDSGRFATERGLALDADDLLRQRVVMDLMCLGRLGFAEIGAAFGLPDAARHFAPELARLAPLAANGLVRITREAVEVTPAGCYVVRVVAMAFDAHLHRSRAARVVPLRDSSFSRIA
jgi:oxygen-independent coproporphyrinogen III oxidase